MNGWMWKGEMISGSPATILQRIIGVALLESGEDIEVHYRNLSHENYIHLWFLKKSTLCQVLFWAPRVRQSTREARLLFPESLLPREGDRYGSGRQVRQQGNLHGAKIWEDIKTRWCSVIETDGSRGGGQGSTLLCVRGVFVETTKRRPGVREKRLAKIALYIIQ